MAEHYGVNVIAYNNSSEQVAFARERAAALGLDDRVTFVEWQTTGLLDAELRLNQPSEQVGVA